MEQINFEEAFSIAIDWVLSTGPLEWGIGGGVLLLLILLFTLTGKKGRRKRQARLVAPALSIQSFQISPLGRDAYFKVLNSGQLARLSNLLIKGRNDIAVKNAVAGHELKAGESYRILLEASGQKKLDNEFSIELTYMDQLGNVYQQAFPIKQQLARQPKLVKLA